MMTRPTPFATGCAAGSDAAGMAPECDPVGHERLRLTLSAIGDGVIATDENGRITYLNPAAEHLTGWTLTESMGLPLEKVFILVNEETRAAAINPVSLCLRENHMVRLSDHTVLIARDGTEYGIEDSTAPIRDDAGNLTGAVMVFRDVTEQRRLVGEISYQATHDPLTGLLNRAVFEQRLQLAIENAHHSGVHHVLCYMDLDQFKLVNDACGHTAGDQMLQRVAGVLARCVRSRDTVRFGGDEFVLLLEHCEIDQALRVAQKICERIDHVQLVHENRSFRVSASIGLVPVTGHWSLSAALQAADIACYAAKEAGRNCVHVYADFDLGTPTQRQAIDWGSRIERAIQRDEFLLYGQRIHSLSPTGAKPHCEVLLRLQDGAGKLIAPGAFLPAAERFNIAARVDHWTLTKVLNLLRESGRRWHHIDKIAINLSGQSLDDPSFHRTALHLLESSAVDLGRLCFEITETAAITRMESASAFIRDVRGYGVDFSLDDFGSGFSSFGYLKSLSVDYIKIDGRFVRNILNDPVDRATVKCLAEVARVSGKQVIAEWVENEAVAAALQEIGVDYLQGFWRHKPEPLPHALSLP